MRTPRRAPSGLMAGLVGWAPPRGGRRVPFRAVSSRAHPGYRLRRRDRMGAAPLSICRRAALAEAAQRTEGAWRGASEPARLPVPARACRLRASAHARGAIASMRAGGGGYASLDAALGITGRGGCASPSGVLPTFVALLSPPAAVTGAVAAGRSGAFAGIAAGPAGCSRGPSLRRPPESVSRFTTRYRPVAVHAESLADLAHSDARGLVDEPQHLLVTLVGS